MSSSLAIGAVTAVLKSLLDDGLSQLSGITTQQTSVHPPDQIPTNEQETSQLNLFLYHMTPNQGWRNVGLPSRNANGDRQTNPPLALDLHYLLTAYSRQDFHAEILLGYGMQVLHEVPVLTRQTIHEKLSPPGPPGLLQRLLTSELDRQIEQIKICPEVISTEEMFRLWATFQTHYRPTVAYQVSVVLIESKQPTRTTLPVQQRNVTVFPYRQPVVDRVFSADSFDRPITLGSTLLITGYQLQANPTKVRLGAVEVPVSGTALSDTQITLPLAAPPFSIPDLSQLRAGVQPLQIIHDLMLGTPGDPHRGVESNVEAFVLRPKIQRSPPNTGSYQITVSPLQTDTKGQFRTVTIKLEPVIGRDQRVVLLLNEWNGSQSHTFVAASLAADTDTVSFRATGVSPGTYLVRVQVDGAESPVDADTNPASATFNQFTGTPNLTIPP